MYSTRSTNIKKFTFSNNKIKIDNLFILCWKKCVKLAKNVCFSVAGKVL